MLYPLYDCHENVDHKAKFISKNGIFPFIELNGQEVVDKAIIRILVDKFGKNMSGHMEQQQRHVYQ